jgi:hypothetical protein
LHAVRAAKARYWCRLAHLRARYFFAVDVPLAIGMKRIEGRGRRQGCAILARRSRVKNRKNTGDLPKATISTTRSFKALQKITPCNHPASVRHSGQLPGILPMRVNLASPLEGRAVACDPSGKALSSPPVGGDSGHKSDSLAIQIRPRGIRPMAQAQRGIQQLVPLTSSRRPACWRPPSPAPRSRARRWSSAAAVHIRVTKARGFRGSFRAFLSHAARRGERPRVEK